MQNCLVSVTSNERHLEEANALVPGLCVEFPRLPLDHRNREEARDHPEEALKHLIRKVGQAVGAVESVAHHPSILGAHIHIHIHIHIGGRG